MTTQPGCPDLAGIFRMFLEVAGRERILFGTDSSVFPRGYRNDLLDAQRTALDQAGASVDDQEAILGGNLARLVPACRAT